MALRSAPEYRVRRPNPRHRVRSRRSVRQAFSPTAECVPAAHEPCVPKNKHRRPFVSTLAPAMTNSTTRGTSMKITRRFTKAGKSPYDTHQIPPRHERDQEPRRLDRLPPRRLHRARAQWSQVAADILAQKYFRKAGVARRLKKRRGDADPLVGVALRRPMSAPSAELPQARALRRRDRRPPGLRPPRRHLDLLGPEGRLLLDRGGRAGLLRRAPLHAGDADGARPTARSGSTPACTGPTASTAPARATSTSTTRPAS